MLNHTTYVIYRVDPLKHMMRKTYHNTQTTKWILFFLEFQLIFINQKSIKGQVIVDQLAEVPIKETTPLEITLHDEDVFKVDKIEGVVETQEYYDMNMYFNGLKFE